jgi:hypothetical protein
MKQQAVFRWAIVAAAVGAPAVAAVLYLAEPTDNSWYPRCVLFSLTGIHCPFCGATRCGHALLHGDLAQAAAYNVITIPLLPLAVLFLYWCAWRSLRSRPIPTWNLPGWVPRLFLVLVVVFWVMRNLPFYPFTLLAPHKLQG